MKDKEETAALDTYKVWNNQAALSCRVLRCVLECAL